MKQGLAAIAGLAVAGMVIQANPSSAAIAACQSATGDRPAMTVHSVFAEPTNDFTRQQSELGSRPGLTGFRLMGLTEIEKTSRISVGIRYRHLRERDGVCFDVADIRVTLIAEPVQIYIAANHAEGSCPFKVTLRHENKHVAIERAALTHHADSLRRRLRRTNRRGWRYAVSPDAAVRAARQWVETIVSAALRATERHAAAQHAQLDSPDNYRRELTQCSDAPASPAAKPTFGDATLPIGAG